MELSPSERDTLVEISLKEAGLADIAKLLQQARAEVATLTARLDRVETELGLPRRARVDPKKKADA